MNSELVFKTVFPTVSGSHGAFMLSLGTLFQVMCGCRGVGVGVCGGGRWREGRKEGGREVQSS